jgi:hypothetical protein
MKIKVKKEKNDVKREAYLGENGQFVLYGQYLLYYCIFLISKMSIFTFKILVLVTSTVSSRF